MFFKLTGYYLRSNAERDDHISISIEGLITHLSVVVYVIFSRVKEVPENF